jgi:hypothetical protein
MTALGVAGVVSDPFDEGSGTVAAGSLDSAVEDDTVNAELSSAGKYKLSWQDKQEQATMTYSGDTSENNIYDENFTNRLIDSSADNVPGRIPISTKTKVLTVTSGLAVGATLYDDLKNGNN